MEKPNELSSNLDWAAYYEQQVKLYEPTDPARRHCLNERDWYLAEAIAQGE